jgi:hypothetical protein
VQVRPRRRFGDGASVSAPGDPAGRRRRGGGASAIGGRQGKRLRGQLLDERAELGGWDNAKLFPLHLLQGRELAAGFGAPAGAGVEPDELAVEFLAQGIGVGGLL